MNPFEGYRISSPFGMRIHPIGKVNKMHWGIDLTQYRGYPIPAFTEGIVEFTGGDLKTGFGLYARIRDKYGARHYYAHLDAFRCTAGQTLKQGDIVGLLGNTGVSTGPHLHYEVRPVGSSTGVDPTKYLLDYYEKEKPKMEKEDANKIIRFMSAGWFVVQGNKEAEAEFNRLANELRKASGQEEQ